MTTSFQLVCKDDAELGIILSAIFGGLVSYGKQSLEQKAELEKIKQEKTSLGIDYDSVKYELDQLKKSIILDKKKIVSVEATPTVEGAKQLLKTQGYDVYMRKKKREKKK